MTVDLHQISLHLTGRASLDEGSNCYIGQAVNLSERYKAWKMSFARPMEYKCLLWEAVQEHGFTNFTWGVLEYCKPEDLDERENHWWALLKPKYNVVRPPHSKEPEPVASSLLLCPMCDTPLAKAITGRPRRFCSQACRQRNYEHGLRRAA